MIFKFTINLFSAIKELAEIWKYSTVFLWSTKCSRLSEVNIQYIATEDASFINTDVIVLSGLLLENISSKTFLLYLNITTKILQ